MAYPSNPNSCNVMSMLNAGTAFSSPNLNASTALLGQMSAVSGLVNSLPSLASGVNGLDPSLISSLQSQITGFSTSMVSGVAYNAISGLTSHLTSQISGLVGNLAMSVAHQSAQAGLAGTGGGCSFPSNTTNTSNAACFNMSQAFSSLTNEASSALGGLGLNTVIGNISDQLDSVTQLININGGTAIFSGALSDITSTLGQLTSTIGTAVTSVESAAGQVTNLISQEVSQLANMQAELLNFANISSLFGLPSNPCAANVLSSVATPGMAAALGL